RSSAPGEGHTRDRDLVRLDATAAKPRRQRAGPRPPTGLEGPTGAHARDVRERLGLRSAGLAADRQNPRGPGAARRLDLDGVTHLAAEQRAAHRRIRRDAADARDLKVQPLAVLVLDLDARSDPDGVA